MMCQRNSKHPSFFSITLEHIVLSIAVGVFAALIFVSLNGIPVYAQAPQKPVSVPLGGETELFVGKIIERESSGKLSDQNHYYLIRVNAGQYFQIKVERDEALSDDVDVRLSNPDAELLTVKRFDSEGTLIIDISEVAKISGTYRVKITSYEKARYKVTLVKKRRATAQERERFAAEEKAKLLTDSSGRRADGLPLKWTNVADRREIIRRYEEGAKWWHAAGDQAKEYETLGEVSSRYGSLGDFQMSLRTLEKSLLVAREANKPTFEFTALFAIGLVYGKLNEPQRAIKYLRKAVALLQTEEMRRDWLAQYKPGRHSDFTLQSYAHLQLSRTEILERRTKADLYELEARTLIYIADIHQNLGEAAHSAEVYTQALAAARSSSKAMLSDGYGELSGIVRLVAQSYINAQQRERALNLIGEEIKRAAGSTLEPMLRELLVHAKLGDVFPEKKPPATGKLADIKPMTTRAGQYLDEAAKLREENTNEAKRRAIAKYEEAALVADENKNYDKFAALRSIAELYKELGEPDRALEYWRRFLADLRLASNAAQPLSSYEAGALEQIGAIYDERGDHPAALENYRQALNLTRNRDNYNSIMTIKKILEIHRRTNQAERAAEFLEKEIAQARVDKNSEVEDTLSEILGELKKGRQ